MSQFFNILNGATKGFFLDNLYKSKDVNKNVLPKPNFKDPWWKEGGGVKKNKKKTEVKKSSKSLNKTIGSRTPSPTDSDEKSSLENNFEAIPRNSIEKDQEIVNDYINKAIELIKSEYPHINIDYFVKEDLPPYKKLPSYQQLFRINRFLYQNNLANAAEKLKDKIYGGVKTKKSKKKQELLNPSLISPVPLNDNRGSIQDLINASEEIGSYHYDSNLGPLPGPVPNFYRGGPTIDRMRPRPPSPSPSPSSPISAPSSPIPEGRKKLREEQEDPNPSLIFPVPLSEPKQNISNPRNVRHRLFQYPNSNKTPTPRREIIDLTESPSPTTTEIEEEEFPVIGIQSMTPPKNWQMLSARKEKNERKQKRHNERDSSGKFTRKRKKGGKTKKSKKSKKIKNKTRKQKGKGCTTSVPLYSDSSSDSSTDGEIRQFLRTRNNRRRRNFSISNRETRQSPLSIINKTTRTRKQRKQPKPKRTKGGSKTKKLK
tara:strand:- start:729 stop:2183 length:1455 start_codon:yes stop_codon:yes gene_type:complete